MPTPLANPCPNGPVVVSNPGVKPLSGWPGVLLPHWRKCLISSKGKLYPVRCNKLYSNIEPCPADNTNLSRLNQFGFAGLWCKNFVHNTYPIGAAPKGRPGWPLSAFCTASTERKRIVLMQSSSRFEVLGFSSVEIFIGVIFDM